MRMGVLGGAFDPPHLGHLALAEGGIERFALDRLLVRVVADPGHKAVATPTGVRLRLTQLAFADVAGAEVSLDPHGRTVDSLEALGLDDPVFLVGADEFAAFLDWKEPGRVLELARLGVATRPGYRLEDLEPVLSRLERRDRVVLFEIEPRDISSTAIRLIVGTGDEPDLFVAPAVAEEIGRLGLYRQLTGRG